MEIQVIHLPLDQNKDYGVTVFKAKNTQDLPFWDLFRLQGVMEIFQTCQNIIDFGDASRGLSELLSDHTCAEMRLSIDIDPTSARDVVADICQLPFNDSSLDGIICASILEHVYNPFLAVSELHRILKPGGKMFVHVPWMFPYHRGEGYQDFFRFSKDGIRYMFKEFSQIEICPIRGRIETVLNFIPRLNNRSRFMRLFGSIVRNLDISSPVHTSGYNFFVVK